MNYDIKTKFNRFGAMLDYVGSMLALPSHYFGGPTVIMLNLITCTLL